MTALLLDPALPRRIELIDTGSKKKFRHFA
jgi:hypothetical protein